MDDVLAVAKEIRSAFSAKTPVLYGGSVDKHTMIPFLSSSEISGFLVGGASLDASMFSAITHAS